MWKRVEKMNMSSQSGERIKVLCEQTRELTDALHDFFWIMFNVIWFREFCVWLSYLEYEK